MFNFFFKRWQKVIFSHYFYRSVFSRMMNASCWLITIFQNFPYFKISWLPCFKSFIQCLLWSCLAWWFNICRANFNFWKYISLYFFARAVISIDIGHVLCRHKWLIFIFLKNCWILNRCNMYFLCNYRLFFQSWHILFWYIWIKFNSPIEHRGGSVLMLYTDLFLVLHRKFILY